MASFLKQFLDRRADGLKEESELKEAVESGKIYVNKKIEIEEDPNLSDDEFWDISNQFNKQIKNSNKTPVEILQKILENYSPLKIQQFADKFKELNS